MFNLLSQIFVNWSNKSLLCTRGEIWNKFPPVTAMEFVGIVIFRPPRRRWDGGVSFAIEGVPGTEPVWRPEMDVGVPGAEEEVGVPGAEEDVGVPGAEVVGELERGTESEGIWTWADVVGVEGVETVRTIALWWRTETPNWICPGPK